MIDYEELLRKYMDIVIAFEGCSFVQHAREPDFTVAEIEQLNAIDASIPVSPPLTKAQIADLFLPGVKKAFENDK